MSQTVKMPDGSVNEFPDEATPDMISQALGLKQSTTADATPTIQAPKQSFPQGPIPDTGYNIQPPSPVNDKIFEQTQPGASSILKTVQSDLINPAKAAAIAASNAMEGGPLGQDMIEGMRKAGVLNDYMKGEDDFIKNINEAILRPAAIALDAAMRGSNAAITGVTAGIGQLITGEKPDRAAEHAQDFTNYLYIASGLNEQGIPTEALSEPKLVPRDEAQLPPGQVETPKLPPPMRETAGPSQPVPKENPAIDESGNLNLKYIKTSDDAKEVLADTAQAYADKNGTIVPRIKSTQQAEQIFQDAMQKAGDGVPENIADHMVGDPVNRMLLGTARRYVVQAATDFIKARQTGDLETASEAFGRLEQAQGIRHEVSAEAGRTLEFHKEVIGGEEGENMEQLAEKLKGMTPEEAYHATTGLDTPQQLAQFVRDTQKPGWGEMGLFYVMNNLLSGPITHTAYAASWAVQSLIRMGIETPIAAGVGKLQELSGKILDADEVNSLTKEREDLIERMSEATSTQGRKLSAIEALPIKNRIEAIENKLNWSSTVTIGEAHARAYGMGEGALEAIKAMGRTLKTGSIQLLPGELDKAKAVFKEKQEAAIKAGKSQEEARQIGQHAYNELTMDMSNPIMKRAETVQNPAVRAFVKGLGWTIGIPFRAAGSIHTLQKFASYYESRNALAFRQALSEGLKGDEIGNRIAQLKTNMPDEMQMQAVEEAQYSALIETSGPLGRGFQNFINSAPAMRFIVPFTKIPTNLIAQKYLERSPIGLFAPSFWQKTLGKEGAVSQANAVAKMVSGTILLTAGGWLAAKGYNNGEGPEKKQDIAFNRLIGNQPYTVRIDDVNIPHRWLGVSGGSLSMGADAYNIMQRVELSDNKLLALFGGAAHFLGNDMLEDNGVTGLSNIIDAVHDKENFGETFVKNTVSKFLTPGSVFQTQTSKLLDPIVRQTTSKDFYESMKETMQANTPFISRQLAPDVDVLGRPMLRNADHDAALNDPLIKEFDRLSFHPTRVEPRLGNTALSHEQFFDYQSKAGQIFAYKARQDIANPDWMKLDSATQFQQLHRDLKIGRECAKAYMSMKYPEITVKSVRKNLDVCNMDTE